MGFYNNLSLGDTDGELFSDEGWHVDDRRPNHALTGAPAGAVNDRQPPATPTHPSASQGGAPTEATTPAASVLNRIDTFIAAALEDFVVDTANLLAAAEATRPRDADVLDEIKFWRSQNRAFVKAQHYFANGVRLSATPSGYTVPSASRPGALVHRLHRAGGVWLCTCEAGQRGVFHWHAALIAGYERGYELADLESREDDPSPILVEHTPPGLTLSRDDVTLVVATPAEVAQAIGRLSPAARMGQRLALARAAHS